MNKTIVIYQDEGVGDFGLSCLQSFFKNDDVRLVDAQAVIDNSALSGADIFVMPGGADLPYCRKLNGAGNRNIRAFVENGGTYLGICAGAYYACRHIEFHKGREDEICESRELALIDTTAIGSLPELAPYYDDTLRTVAAVRLITPDQSETVCAYYHGGCYFTPGDEASVHARYDMRGNPAAIMEKPVGKGRVILSGVHLEISADDVKNYPLEDGDDPADLDKIAGRLADSHLLLGRLLRGEPAS